MGGTLLTVQGRFFDETDQPARVLVGGNRHHRNRNSYKHYTCFQYKVFSMNG